VDDEGVIVSIGCTKDTLKAAVEETWDSGILYRKRKESGGEDSRETRETRAARWIPKTEGKQEHREPWC